MTPLAIRRAVRPTSRLTRFLLALSLCVAAGRTFAAVVGDQVELTKARHDIPYISAELTRLTLSAPA